MSWVAELRAAFSQVQVGGCPRVAFADREDTVGELGREFNALAAGLEQASPQGLTREQAHSLRNRLAGILAVLQLLRESGDLTRPDQAAVQEVFENARHLDARLRPR